MSREEFLRGLQAALSGNVPPSVVQENLKYYDDYIRSEVSGGRPEHQALEELGDPRLIARTIIDATPDAEDNGFEEYRGASYGSFESDAGSDSTGSTRSSSAQGSSDIHYYDLNKWYWKLLGIVIVIAVITLILAVLGGILSIVIPMLPILIVVMVVMWIVRGPKQ